MTERGGTGPLFFCRILAPPQTIFDRILAPPSGRRPGADAPPRYATVEGAPYIVCEETHPRGPHIVSEEIDPRGPPYNKGRN